MEKFIPQGIISAMLTAMNDDESINSAGMKKMTRRLIDAGVHGLFALGTTAEFFSMNDDEKETVVAAVEEENNGKLPLYAGAGSISTKGVIKTIERLSRHKIDGFSVITPYFLGLSQNELYEHFKAVAESTDLPVLLYNIPGRTMLHLEPETVAKLADIKNIMGIKDSSGKFENIKGYIDATRGKDFYVLAGSDSLIFDTLMYGGTGAIAATTNAIPELVVSLYNKFKAGDIEGARAAQEAIGPLRACILSGTVPGMLKAAANILGVPAGPARLPILPPDDSKKAQIKEVLNSYIEKGLIPNRTPIV